MNKKFILPISLLLLVGLAIFVSASMSVINENSDAKQYAVEIQVTKGWNLIASGLTFVSDLSYLDKSGDIKKENIKAVYVYADKINDYISSYPKYDERLYSASNYFKGDERDIIGKSNWIYVDKSGILKYKTKGIKTIDKTKLYSGWNFVSITPEFEGKSLNELEGSCNIEKVYHYEALIQGWSPNLANDDFMEEKLTQDSFGLGIVIKVSDDCNLGSGDSSVTPPTIPNIDSSINDNSELLIKKDFGSLKINRVLGQEYVEREYHSFPLDKMIRADAIKYGSGVGINSIIMKFRGDNNINLNKILTVYDTSFDIELLTPPAYPKIYKLTKTNNLNNQIALWYSEEYIILIHGDNLFIDGSDAEQIIEDYLEKYPSTLI